jgi:hypothetical protein
MDDLEFKYETILKPDNKFMVQLMERKVCHMILKLLCGFCMDFIKDKYIRQLFLYKSSYPFKISLELEK